MTSDANPEPADQPAEQPGGKRRWFQFSLRAMFVWVTVIAVLLTVGHNVDYPSECGWCVREPLEP